MNIERKIQNNGPVKFMCYGQKIMNNIGQFGWYPGARYTNLRTVRQFDRLGFLDIDWRRYCFESHLLALQKTRPVLSVARDVLCVSEIDSIRREVDQILLYASYAIVVPKDNRIRQRDLENWGDRVIMGYSVPSKYGSTNISPELLQGPVHLLGGSPVNQRRLAEIMNVVSFDNNSIAITARYGRYFDGVKEQTHPSKNLFYEDCIYRSLQGINLLWEGYSVTPVRRLSDELHRSLEIG